MTLVNREAPMSVGSWIAVVVLAISVLGSFIVSSKDIAVNSAQIENAKETHKVETERTDKKLDRINEKLDRLLERD